MKLLKFRAWLEKEKKMINVEQLDCLLDGKPIVCQSDNGSPPFFNLGELPIMQYIGSEDINGKEMYEGDILKIDKEENVAILYDENNCCFTLNTDSDFNPCLSRYEVIGNIYQNPEFLNNLDTI